MSSFQWALERIITGDEVIQCCCKVMVQDAILTWPRVVAGDETPEGGPPNTPHTVNTCTTLAMISIRHTAYYSSRDVVTKGLKCYAITIHISTIDQVPGGKGVVPTYLKRQLYHYYAFNVVQTCETPPSACRLTH